jgi:hypothetical protein
MRRQEKNEENKVKVDTSEYIDGGVDPVNVDARAGEPQVLRPKVDKLACIIPVACAHEEEDWQFSAIAKVRAAVEAGVCVPQRGYSSNYLESVWYVGSDGGRCLIQVGSRNLGQKGCVRFEFNPSGFSHREARALRTFLGRLFPEQGTQAVDASLVNRLDVAVDVVGVAPRQLFISYSHAQKFVTLSKQFGGRRSRLESLWFGGFDSDYACVVYDKKIQRVHHALKRMLGRNRLGTAPLTEISVHLRRLKRSAEVTRFELRGMKMRGIALHALRGRSNRFQRFRIWSAAPLDSLPEPVRSLTTVTCHQLGVPGFLRLMNGHKFEAKLRDLLSEQVVWWKPDELWIQAVEELMTMGLFGKKAFIASTENVGR